MLLDFISVSIIVIITELLCEYVRDIVSFNAASTSIHLHFDRGYSLHNGILKWIMMYFAILPSTNSPITSLLDIQIKSYWANVCEYVRDLLYFNAST